MASSLSVHPGSLYTGVSRAALYRTVSDTMPFVSLRAGLGSGAILSGGFGANRYMYWNASGMGGVRAESDVGKEPMVPPYNVLITGSSKGIGYALAKDFLKAGDNVPICSRSADRVESAVASLRKEFGERRVWGTVCDVRVGKDVKALVEYACENLKYIDIWYCWQQFS